MTIPDPTPGQVWEDVREGVVEGRRARLDEAYDDGWFVEFTAYPGRPDLIGFVTYLSARTLHTKWRFIEEAPK